jgi:hypothetical protein
MRKTIRVTSFLLLIALAGWAVSAAGPSSPAPLGITPTPTPTPQPLSVSLWTDKSTYMLGEAVRVTYTVSQPAYIYLYDIQPHGVVLIVFPNAYSQANFVSAGTHTLPDGAYQFLVSPPLGVEQLQIFASLTPLPFNPTSYSEPYPTVAPNPNAAMQQLQVQIQGITPTPAWATAWASFTITSASYGYTPPGYNPPGYPSYPPSFYPPFFGWGPGQGQWFFDHGQWYFGTPGSGWYWYYSPDGKWHMIFRIHIGGGS